MTVRENVAKLLKDLVLPEIQALRGQVGRIEIRLDAVEKRLDDFAGRFQAIDQHLVDQSRRIDELRTELAARIDGVREELTTRIDQQTARIDQLNLRVDHLSVQVGNLAQEVGALRQDREVVGDLVRRVGQLEAKVAA
jgi:chromosome segregation ATPase